MEENKSIAFTYLILVTFLVALYVILEGTMF